MRFEYTYNDNTDLPTFIYHRHTTTPVAGNNYTYIVGKTLSYGPANRINELIMAVNNPANQTIVAQYDYNPIGQHTEKNLHKPDGAADFLQSVDYRYNNRGWMTSINDQTNLNNETGTIALAPDLYAQILLYTSTGAFGGTNQFNGNISSTYWRNATDFVERGYAFSYDEMNRLKKSYSSTTSTDGNWDEQCAYDPAGNILSLQRRGNTGASSYGLIDRMHYNYIFSGTGIKKLNAIDDQITASFPANDFEDNGSLFSAVTIPEYIYDANGNIVTDYNKGITTRYNHLNLPDKVTFHSTGNTITWLYTATGRKLQKRTCQVEIGAMPPPPTTPPIDKHRFYSARLDSVGSARLPGTDTLTEGEYYHNISDRIQFIKRMLPPTFTPPPESMPPPEELPTNCEKRDYIGSVEYDNNIAESYYHDEGRINLLPGMNNRHEYNLRDHLGNTRIYFTDSDNDGTPEILQQTTYYPFGLPIQELSTTFDGEGNNYQYNGKELNEDFGLHWMDYGARWYDPQINRWGQVDPLAEKYYAWSGYNYVLGNPVIFVDPDGRSPFPPSTHLDDEGNVAAVFNDGDNNVYQHGKNADGGNPTEYMLSKRQEKWGTSAGGTKVGETEHWDEFVSPETGKTMTNYKLQLCKSFDPIISNMHTKAEDMDLINIAMASRGGGLFDIKKDYANIGGLLNGKFATSRSAGNYLAGYNAEGGTYLGVGISFTTFQKLAGALHIEESSGNKLSKGQMLDIVIFGTYKSSDISKFVAPTYGEVDYQYRMSKAGWGFGKKK